MNIKKLTKIYITLLLCLVLLGLSTACSDTASDGSGADEEYTAYVDQDAHSCSVEYLGTQVDIDEAELNDEDGDFLVLHMTFWNELDLVTHDSDVDDLENQDSMDRSFVIRAVQGDQVIEPRDETETETFEEDNVYEMIDAGSSVECEYWFPVDPQEPVTIQIMTPDGNDTVMAELEYAPEDLE